MGGKKNGKKSKSSEKKTTDDSKAQKLANTSLQLKDPQQNAMRAMQLQRPQQPQQQMRHIPLIAKPLKTGIIIGRNKHWRYLSAYHGPWLQVPVEGLEALALHNGRQKPPQFIDPATCFNLVKIRRLVEDATSLAVRAANGTPSSAGNNFRNSGNATFRGQNAAYLGFLFNAHGGSNTPLSRERIFRMRGQATRKLAEAYRTDEIAANMAIMQSASSIEQIAKIVLEREPNNSDAKYVHFFQEKIPSGKLAEYTDTTSLDEIIDSGQFQENPAAYRTRALTKMLKGDHLGAVADLTEGLVGCRALSEKEPQTHHPRHDGDARHELNANDEDQPSSMEMQLLFHRANAYLELACSYIEASLEKSKNEEQPDTDDLVANTKNEKQDMDELVDNTAKTTLLETTKEDAPAHECLEARKLVKKYAKRALRDYLTFLSNFSYSPDYPFVPSDNCMEHARQGGEGDEEGAKAQVAEHTPGPKGSATPASTGSHAPHQQKSSNPPSPPLKAYTLSDLFSPVPMSDLPPFPPSPVPREATFEGRTFILREAVTFHPLLVEALHSLLHCHCLIQTSATELLRHAYMTARLVRSSDGYPVFLPARSPGRANWIKLLHLTNNWLGVSEPWETLSASPPSSTRRKFQEGVGRNDQARAKAFQVTTAGQDAIFDAETRTSEPKANMMKKDDKEPQSFRSVEEIFNHFEGSKRAEIIARWVMEAPLGIIGEGGKKKKGKKPKK